ncbi:MAG TPA: hypothetical protein VMW95_02875 [Desulfobacterales bacterium]|nr:hypothetical protein [Desulfobacterales bacterium]
MSDIVITISIKKDFSEKFIGFLRNLTALNGDKSPILKIVSIESSDTFVAFPKEEDDDNKS